MALTTEGIEVTTKFKGLQSGEGWTLEIKVNLDAPTQEAGNARSKAFELGIAGRIVNGHEANFGLVVGRIKTEIDDLRDQWSQFITDWNNGVYENE